jgi:hypothetical protein
MLRDLYAIWCSHTTQTHCDHIMGPLQGRYKVYAPEPFVFGQAHSVSDISGTVNPAKFWQPPDGKEPVLVLHCPAAVVAELRDYGVHTGYDRDPVTDLDRGLVEVFRSGDDGRLKKWIDDLQWECVSEEDTVLGLWHPEATDKQVRRCWSGKVIGVQADTIEAAVTAIRERGVALKRRVAPAREFVVVLTADRAVAGQLRGLGWHTGHWRDPITDLDNGLRAWALSKRPDELAEIIRTLAKQAEGLRGGVACIWHPEATVPLVQAATSLRAVPIVADSVEAALQQWEAATGKAAANGS